MISCYITSQVVARTTATIWSPAPSYSPPRLISKSTPSASGTAYYGVPPRSPHDAKKGTPHFSDFSASTHSRYFIISGFSLQCLDVEDQWASRQSSPSPLLALGQLVTFTKLYQVGHMYSRLLRCCSSCSFYFRGCV
jgi:hypothetical protein